MAGRDKPLSCHVRVLHLVSPSQKYIFSDSLVPMTVCPLPPKPQLENSPPQPRFAAVSLKACIDIICDSSSELFDDGSNDYSVYSLDPWESYGKEEAIRALGRMSSLRSLNASSLIINGAMSENPLGQELLEVVFLLVVTRAPLKVPDPAAAHRINAALARQEVDGQGRAKRKREQVQGQPPRIKPKPAQITEADRILAQYGARKPAEPGPGPEHQPTVAVPISLTPEVNEILATFGNHPDVNQAALWQVSNFISFLMTQRPGLTVAEALKMLTPNVAVPASATSVSTGQGPQTPPLTPVASNEPPSPDDAILILDKENVDPDSFRRRVGRAVGDKVGIELSASTSAATSASSEPPLPMTVPVSTARKRTISEALLEDSQSSSATSSSSRPLFVKFYHYPTQARSSPSRPSAANATPSVVSPSGLSKDRPIIIPDSPSPVKPKPPRQPRQPEGPHSPTTARRNGSGARLHPYIPPSIPPWARTSTATQPRLSEQVQQTIKDREDKKLEEKKGKRLKWTQQRKVDTGERGAMHRTISTPAVFSTSDVISLQVSASSTSATTSALMAPPPPPVMSVASVSPPSLPVVAVVEHNTLLSSSSTDRHLAPPCTPPRRRAFSATALQSLSPALQDEDEDASLFTPDASSREQRLSLFTPILHIHRDEEATPPPLSEQILEDLGSEDEGEDADDVLTRELDDALLGASRLFEQPSAGMGLGEDGLEHGEETKDDESEHKSIRLSLPPSSPPAPSSPILQLYQDTNDLDDDTALPLPSSDFNVDNDEDPFEADCGPTDKTFDDEAAVDQVGVAGVDEAAILAIIEMLTKNENGNNADSTSSAADSPLDDILKGLDAIPDEEDPIFSLGPNFPLSQNHPDSPSLPEGINFENFGFWDTIVSAQTQTGCASVGPEK
ncbi:hypothetical protein D9757_005601 [Collybiopsis confluens]|uniref:Uncharacterized protein n=1 Tax=Collybiopsis confluens TaxID=2823264 RepID=A0A8H5MCE4_9AGAR|nr:hypothetical protein D9757_005601 [Collybiopsis confluens]